MTSDKFLNSPEFFLCSVSNKNNTMISFKEQILLSVGVCLAHCCVSPSDTVPGMCEIAHREASAECIEVQVL